jgi:hypothetical protein
MSTEPPGPVEDDSSDTAAEVKGPLWSYEQGVDYLLKSDRFLCSVNGWDFYDSGRFLFVLSARDGLNVHSFDEDEGRLIQRRGDQPLPESVKDYINAYRKLIS